MKNIETSTNFGRSPDFDCSQNTVSVCENAKRQDYFERLADAKSELERANSDLSQYLTSVNQSMVKNLKTLDPELDEYVSNNIKDLYITD